MLRTGSSNRSPDRSMRSIGRIFSPITSLPMWTRRSISRRSGPTHDLIWENIELFAARYLTTNLRIDVRPFVLSGIDVGADVRDMIVGGDESKTSLSLFGDIATDLPVSFSAEPSFEAEVEGSDRTLFSFPSFTVFPTAEAPVEIEETSVSADALTVIFDQETRIELNMQLENYYPGRSLDLGQGITINLKVRKKGGLIFNV